MEKKRKSIMKNPVLRGVAILLVIALSFFIGSKTGSKGVSEHVGHGPGVATEEAEKEVVWTCSMHPSIQLPKFGQCPICFMDLIPVEPGAGGDPDAPRLTMSESARKLAGIMTAPVIRKGVASDIKMVGKVDFDESRMEKIAARISGRIDKLYVEYTGIPVKKGDHLAEIYSPELLSLQKELLEASTAVNNLSPDISDMVRQSVERTFKAAKEKLRLLGFTEKELQELLSRGETTDHMTIRSTQRGVVIKKLVEEGQYVKMGMPLFQIADLRKVWVKLDAYESDLSWIRLGQRVAFMVEAYPGRTFRGKITFIDPVVNPETRTVMVRVNTDNSKGMLKPDMFVKATVKISVSKSGKVVSSSIRDKFICPMHPEVIKDGKGECNICGMPLEPAAELGYVTSGHAHRYPLIIPASAPLITGERAIVYIQDMDEDEPTYEGKEIVLGPRAGDYYIVKSGLTEGDMVVVNGAFKIDGELQIRARPSMMNPKKEKEKKVFIAEKKVNRVKEPISKDVRNTLESIFGSYLALSDALAADDYKTSMKAMKELKKKVDGASDGNGKIYEQYNESIEKMKKKLSKMRIIRNIEEARTMFEVFSDQTILLEKRYGHIMNKSIHLTFCPMAFNDKGAYWLQTRDVVNNPYFGSKMLKCGTIKDTYKPKK